MKEMSREYKIFLFIFLSPLGVHIYYKDFKKNYLKFFIFILKFFVDLLLIIYFIKCGFIYFILFVIGWIFLFIMCSLNIEVLKTNYIYVNNDIYDLDDLIAKNETISLNYKGEKDSEYKRRNIKIKSYEKKNNKTYLQVYDLDKKGSRTFRKDRIK